MNGQPERDIRGLYSILSDAKTMNGDTFPGDFNTFAKYIQRDDIRQGLYRKLHGRGIFGGSYEDFQNTFLNPYASETNQVEALRNKTFTLDPRKEMARQRALLDASRGEYNPYGTSEVSYNPDRRMRGTEIAPIDLVESEDTLPEIATSAGPKTTRTFWGGVVSGARGIHGGAQIAVADLMKGFGGNSDDEKEAIHLINQMEQDGTLSIERVHGVREKLLKELDSYTNSDIRFSGDYSKKARQADALKLIEERMQRMGQDLTPEKRAVALDAMRSDLSEKGASEDKANPFVRWKEGAKDYMRKSEVPEGTWAELGSATASVGGAIAGQALSMIPGLAPVGQAISWASIGAQTLSSGGQAIMDMEDYAAEKGVYISPEDKATIALGYMAAEFGGDALGGAVASKSISAIGKLAGGRLGQKLAVRSLAKGIAGNEGVRKSLSSMSEYARKPLAIPLAKSAGRQIVRGAVTEGPGESLTTLAQSGALDRVWKSKEDQEAWSDVARQAVKDGIYGAWAGALMGGFGSAIQSGQVAHMHRKEGLTIVQDEKNNLYEVIGADQSSYLVLDRAGRQKMLPADQVVDAIHYTPQERQKSQKAYDEATEGLHPKAEEVLTENQKRAGAILSATEQQQSPIYRATHPEVAEEELNSPVALAGAKQAVADMLEGQNEEVKTRVDQMALVLKDGEADPTEELTKLFSDESLSDNDRQSILDVVTAQSRLSTIERSHQEAMAQMQSELTKEWSAKSVVGDETARGAVISATITDADGQPKQVYVTGGVRVVTNEDGTVELLPTDDDAPIYVYDESVDGDEKGHIVQMDDLSSPQLVAEDYLDVVQALINEAETAFRSEVQAADWEATKQKYGVKLSEEVDENGKNFVLNSEGEKSFGQIPEGLEIPAGDILLSEGDRSGDGGINYGLKHIEDRHGNEIRANGFRSVVDFVEYVASHYNRIKRGTNGAGDPNGTYLLQLTDEHNNTVYIELSQDGTYWRVNSAGVFHKGYGNNKETIRPASAVQGETPQSHHTLPTPNDNGGYSEDANGTVYESSLRQGKGTEKSEGEQENESGGLLIDHLSIRGEKGEQPQGLQSELPTDLYDKGTEKSEGEQFLSTLPRTRGGEVDGLKLMSERPDDFIRYLGQLYGEDFVASLPLSKSGALDLKTLTPEQTLKVNEAALGKSGAVEAARQRRSKVGAERSKLEAEVKSDLGNLEKRMALRKASEEYRLYDDYVRTAEEQARQEREAQKRAEEAALTPEERQRREEEKRQPAQEIKDREERIRLENERRRREREELERNAEGSTVREYTEDPPRQARARGARLVNGAVVYRQEPMTVEHYADAERAFSQRPGETRIPVKRTIVEAESLQASHKEGQMNPRHFIPEAQPKDRADNGLSSTAADRIASDIRPDEITGGITAYTGAPVVNGRGEVIQGNNRTDALQTMYDGEERHAKSAELYKEYLKAHASEYGMTAEQVDAMNHPVAVDVAEVSDSEAIRLGHRGQTDLESAGADTMNAQTVGEELNSDTDPASGQSMLVSFFNRIFSRTGANGAELSAKMDNMLNRNAEEGLKFLHENGYITDTQYKNAFETNSEGKRVVTAEAKTALKDVALYQLADVIGPRAMDIFYRLPASARNGLATFLYRDSQASFETSLAPDLGDALLVWDSLRQDPDFAGQTNFESAKIFILGKVSLFGRSELETNLGEASSLAKLLAASMQTQTEEQIADVLNQYYDLVGANETGAKTQSLIPTSQPTDTKAGAAEAVYGRVYEVPSGREKHYRFRRDVAEDFRARRDALADRITEERRKRAAAMDMARTLGVPPKLHEDMSTLPDEVRAGFDETHSVKGWFYKGDNAVHIYLPANVDADDVRATFLHEAVGHYGCRELLGEVGYNQVLDGIANKLGEEEVLRAMKEYCDGSQDLADRVQVRIAMDEWIAHRAESGITKKTVWESIKDFFRKVFGLSGKQIDQSAEMMADDLLRRSAKNLQKRAERQTATSPEGSTERAEVRFREGDSVDNERQKGLQDNQGNPIDQQGSLLLDHIEEPAYLTDEDFRNPSRNVSLRELPSAVDSAVGGEGKPVVIKKNIFEKNKRSHPDLTPEDGRQIIESALYRPTIYGQNRKISRPDNWIIIHKEGINSSVVIEVSKMKDAIEVVNWHYVDNRGIEKIKRQSEREGGQLLILPSETTVSKEDGALSIRTLGSSLQDKGKDNSQKEQIENDETRFRRAERDEIRHRAIEDGTWMKAPNGENSNLSERDWVTVRTKAFKDWFGDWETYDDGLLDENYEPRVFYHRSPKAFTEFSREAIGSKTDPGFLGRGFYFFSDPQEGDGYGNNTYPVFLKMKYPYYAENEDVSMLAEAYSSKASSDFTERLKSEGYDGVIYTGDLREELMVFDPEQIKSAIGNAGTFDGTNPDIRYRKAHLAGVHTLTTDNLRHALKMGGLANPSIAVYDTERDLPTRTFGEVALIAPRDLVDAKTGRHKGTYNRDAWTPTYPQVSYELTKNGKDALRSLSNKVRDLGDVASARLLMNEANQSDLSPATIETRLRTNEGVRKLYESEHRGEDYDSYVSSLAKSIEMEDFLFAGQRADGSWNRVPHTLDNVSKLMKRERAEGSKAYPFAYALSKLGSRYRSLSAIRKGEDLLSGKDPAKWEATRKEFADLANELQGEAKSLFDIRGEEHLAALLADGENLFGRPLTVTEEARVSALREQMRALPTDYFETKVDRPVGLSEFVEAVVPEGTSPELVSELEKSGLKVSTYDSTKEGAMNEAVLSAMDRADATDRGVRFRTGEQDLEQVNRTFNEELEKFLAGGLSGGHAFNLGLPGAILRATGIPALPIRMTGYQVTKRTESSNHPFPPAVLRNLPEALQSPVAVFTYGKSKDIRNIIVDIDYNGENILIGLIMNKRQSNLKINDIKGLFPKSTSNWLRWIADKKDLYLDRKKIQALVEARQTNPDSQPLLDLDLIAKVQERLEETKHRDEMIARAELQEGEIDGEKALDQIGIAPPKGASAQADPKLSDIANITNGFENPKVDKATPTDPKLRFRMAERTGDVSGAAEAAVDFMRNATPKNTSVDDVLRFCRVYHNSPHLLKKADGAFVDPETGERLGFDHRFMSSGEGFQAHGWGSYFSVDDLEGYASPNDVEVYDGIRLTQNDAYVTSRGGSTNIASILFQTIRTCWIRNGSIASEKAVKKGVGETLRQIYQEYEQIAREEERLLEALKDKEPWAVTLTSSVRGSSAIDPKTGYEYAPRTSSVEEEKRTYKYAQRQADRYKAALLFTESNPDYVRHFETKIPRHKYVVEIPDPDTNHYIMEDRRLTKHEEEMIRKAINDKWELRDSVLEKRSWRGITGKEAYEDLSLVLGAKQASLLLNEAGFVGIHYNGRIDGECYVIFNENDAQITDHVRFRRTSSEERDKIIEKAKADGSWLLAPDGTPTTLSEEGWIASRSSDFRAEYGDWSNPEVRERSRRIDKLLKSDPIVIPQEGVIDLSHRNRKEIRQWAKENLKRSYTNRDTGDTITISTRGIKEASHHGMNDNAHKMTFAYIPQMIENSIFLYEDPRQHQGAPYAMYRYYVAGMSINGEDYTVRLSVGVDENGRRYYDHGLTQIEKKKLVDFVNQPAKSFTAIEGIPEAAPQLSSAQGKGTKSSVSDKQIPVTHEGQPAESFISMGAEPSVVPDPSVAPLKDKRLVEILQGYLPESFYQANGEPKREIVEEYLKAEEEKVQITDHIRFRRTSETERLEIERKAKADGSWLLAPDGTPTTLSEEGWIASRSSDFRAEYGDWEKAYGARFLLGDRYVKELTGTEFNDRTKSVTSQVTDYYSAVYGGKIMRAGVGEILLDDRSVRNSRYHGINRAKIATFAAVPEVIRKGVLIDEQKDWKGRGYNSLTYAAPVVISGDGYVCTVVIKRTNEDRNNRFYLHTVTLQKDIREWSTSEDVSLSRERNRDALRTGSKSSMRLGEEGTSSPEDSKAVVKPHISTGSTPLTIANVLKEYVSHKDDLLESFYQANGEPKREIVEEYLKAEEEKELRYRRVQSDPMNAISPINPQWDGEWYSPEDLTGKSTADLLELPAAPATPGKRPTQSVAEYAETMSRHYADPRVRFRTGAHKENLRAPQPPRITDGMSLYEVAQLQHEYNRNYRDFSEESMRRMGALDKLPEKFIRSQIDVARPVELFVEEMRHLGLEVSPEDNMYWSLMLQSSKELNMKKREVEPMFERYAETIREMNLDGSLEKVPSVSYVYMKDPNVKKSKSVVKDANGYEKASLYLQAKDIDECKKLGLPYRGEKGFEDLVTNKETGKKLSPEEYISLFESAVGKARAEGLCDQIRAISNWSTQKLYEAGLLTEDRYRELTRGSRRYYVPQRGFKITEDTDRRAYELAELKAEGRQSLSADPVANLQAICNTTVIRAIRNRDLLDFYRWCKKNEQELYHRGVLEMGESYYRRTAEVDDKGRRVYLQSKKAPTLEEMRADNQTRREMAKIRMEKAALREKADRGLISSYTFEAKTKELDDRLKAKEDELIVKYRDPNLSLGDTDKTAKKDERVVRVYENGEERIIALSEDYSGKAVADALNNRSIGRYIDSDNLIAKIFRGWGTITRTLSSLRTQYSWAFAGKNAVRDMKAAVAANMGDFGWAYTQQFLRNVPKVQRAVWEYVWKDNFGDVGDLKSEYGQYMKEFFEDGAATGYSFLEPFNILHKNLKGIAEPTTWNNIVYGQKGENKSLYAAMRMCAVLSEGSELSTRFAEYVTSRERGFSRKEAAIHAKEVTVNFNRHGAMSPYFNTLFGFWNASVQGAYRWYRIPLSFMAKVSAQLFVTGMLQAYLYLSDDDDKEFTEWDLMTNICIGDFRLPIPQNLRAFNGAGLQFMLACMGKKDWEAAVIDAGQFMAGEYLPSEAASLLNVVQWDETRGTLKDGWPQVWRDAAPTGISPIVDVIENRNFMGQPVYKMPYVRSQDDNVAHWSLGKKRTKQVYKDFAEWQWKMRGGSTERNDLMSRNGTSQLSNSKLNNPSVIEHLVEGYGGGPVSGLADIGTWIEFASTGDVKELKKLQMIAPFLRQERDYTATDVKYWELTDLYRSRQQTMSNLRKAKEGEDLERYREMTKRVSELAPRMTGEQLTEKIWEDGTQDEKLYVTWLETKALLKQIDKGTVTKEEVAPTIDRLTEQFRELR